MTPDEEELLLLQSAQSDLLEFGWAQRAFMREDGSRCAISAVNERKSSAGLYKQAIFDLAASLTKDVFPQSIPQVRQEGFFSPYAAATRVLLYNDKVAESAADVHDLFEKAITLVKQRIADAH